MSQPGAKPRRRKFWKYLLIATAASWFALGLLLWYTSTDSFQTMVRHRLVAELERATGGRVELGGFHTIPFRFEVDVRGLTIHGREGRGEVPYAHVDRLVAEVKLISAMGAEFGFRSVVLDRPVVHIISYPDGTTNQPEPRISSKNSPVERLFSFSINRLEVRHGELLWNDQRVPLDFIANDVSADMNYSLLRGHYEGNLLLGKIDTKFQDYRPVAWMMETHFNLGQNSLEVHSLKASSGRSRLEASGRVENFQKPKIDAAYEATLDLAEADAIARHSEIRRGILQAEGKGVWNMQEFSSTGKLSVKDFDWRDRSLGLPGITASSDYAVSSQRLALSQIQAKLLGGVVTGEAEITNWLSSPLASKIAKTKSSEQRGSVSLRLKDLSASEIAAALSSSARPLQQMNLAGDSSGTIETRWRGSARNAESEIALDVAAPARLTPGKLPLNAHTHATYRAASEEFEVADLYAATRFTEVRASGTLSSRTALKLSINTSNLSEWHPTLAALGYQGQIPVALRGHASFNGTATGKLSDIAFEGRLQSQDFDFLIPASARAPAREVRWDLLDADVELSPQVFAARNGVLRRGHTTVDFNFNLRLQERQFTDSSPFTAGMDVRGADVAELLTLAGSPYPASGTANFFIQATGTKAKPRGEGRIQLSDATIYGEAVQHFDSRLEFSGYKVSLGDIHLSHDDAQVTGDGTYDLSTRAFHFSLNGSNFNLARIAALEASRLSVEGRMDFSAQGWGTPEEPTINANIRWHDLTLGHERIGDYTFDAVTQGSQLSVTGRSQIKDAALNIDGDVQLRGDWPANINLHFNHFDVDPVLRTYLRGRLTGHSTATGNLQLRGPLRNPRALEVTGDLSDFYADVEQVKLHNNGPIRFAIANQTIDIRELRLTGEGSDLTVGGTVGLSGEHQLNLQAAGHAGLQLIHSFNPDFTSSGEVAVNLAIAGTIAHPTTQGHLQITSGSIAYRDLPSALSDINGSLVFNQDRLQIETLTAHVGGGLVTFGGYATAYNRQLNFDLTLRSQDMRLRYPPGVSSMTNADLHFAGAPSASTLSGDVMITKLAVTPGFDFGAYLERSAQAAALPQTNPLLNRIRLDVHIVTTPELQMQTAVVRLSGDADLHLQGTAAKPVLLGRADVIEGQIYFNGTKYRMERGDVTFTNPVTTTPVLDLQASTRVREYDITVNLNGEFDKLNMKYLSDPPLPTADIISLLAVGQTQQGSGQLQQTGQSAYTQQATSAALAEALNSALSNRSRSLFGISHIKIDPQGLNTETSPTTTTPAVTIEQQVKDNLTLTYTTNVSQTSQQIIQAEYNVSRNVSILAIRDYNGVVSFEVRIRQRKK